MAAAELARGPPGDEDELARLCAVARDLSEDDAESILKRNTKRTGPLAMPAARVVAEILNKHLPPDGAADVHFVARTFARLCARLIAAGARVRPTVLARCAGDRCDPAFNRPSAERCAVVEQLLDAGADVNAAHGAALMRAVELGDAGLVQLLVDRGAATRDTAFVAAMCRGDVAIARRLHPPPYAGAAFRAALARAARLAEPRALDELLTNAARGEPRDEHAAALSAALRAAVESGRFAHVEMLLRSGAQMDDPQALLRVAADAQNDNDFIIISLIRAGAVPTVDMPLPARLLAATI